METIRVEGCYVFVGSKETLSGDKDIVSIQDQGGDRVRMDLKSLSPEAAQILFGEVMIIIIMVR